MAATLAVSGCSSPPAPTPPPAPAPVAFARAPAPHETITSAALMAHVHWLCAPERAGRGSYQPGGRAAADYVARAFERAGLQVTRQPVTEEADNVIGILPGTGRGAVIVSAHYDHVGVDTDGVVYPGADDNASGVAVMLAMVDAIAPRGGAGRTVIFIGFGAEEDGLQGARAYVEDPVWPLEDTIVVVNFDMVGRNLFELIGTGTPNAVGVVGLEARRENQRAAERAADAEGMRLLKGSARVIGRFGLDGRTDDWWFRQRGVPTIHFSTGLHQDYHKPTDTPDKLRPEQMRRIARLATRLVVDLAEL